MLWIIVNVILAVVCFWAAIEARDSTSMRLALLFGGVLNTIAATLNIITLPL